MADAARGRTLGSLYAPAAMTPLPVPSLLLALALAASAGAQPSTFAVEVTGSGPDVVLIPGLSSSGPVWDGTVARFADTHTLHVVTLTGFGGVPAIGPRP